MTKLDVNETLDRIWKALGNHVHGVRRRADTDSVTIRLSPQTWDGLRTHNGPAVEAVRERVFGFKVRVQDAWALAEDASRIELVIEVQ